MMQLNQDSKKLLFLLQMSLKDILKKNMQIILNVIQKLHTIS